jgi:membrane-bound metal-dependent hydrolase YbcI (DUF457 family)
MATYLRREMMGKSHLLVGAAGYLTVGQALLEVSSGRQLTAGELAAGTVVCAGAAMLPDIDHPMATVSRSLGPVTYLLSRATAKAFGGHRVGTHSLLFAAGASLLVSSALTADPSPLIPFLFCFFFTSLCVKVLAECEPLVGAVIAAALASAMLMAAPADGWLAQAIGLGVLLHIAADAVTSEGVTVLWPFVGQRFSLPLVGASGGLRERLVAGGAGLLAVAVYVQTVLVPQLLGV